MTNTDNVAKKLLATLRTHSPAKVRAYSGDDEYRDIAVPTRRKKWAQVIAAIEARGWSRVELLDKSGAVLGYVENDGAPEGVEDITGPVASKTRSDVEWMVNLALRVQREAVESRNEETRVLLRAQSEMVTQTTQAMQSLATLYREQVQVTADSAEVKLQAQLEAAAASQTGDGFNMKELMDAMPVIMQVLPALKAMVNGKPASAPTGKPNGVSHG